MDKLLIEARENFPKAISDVEALDNYAKKIYEELCLMKDKESEEYLMLAAKYRNVRLVYKRTLKDKIEEESSFKTIAVN